MSAEQPHDHPGAGPTAGPQEREDGFRSGFVAIVGRPNVGKSTLMNRLVGTPVSITTPKPQTTRNRILGVRSGEGWQVVYVDTPGIHRAFSPLNVRMVRYATAALADADLVLALVEPLRDPARGPDAETRLVLERVRAAGRPTLLVLNKTDLAGEARVLASIEAFAALEPGAEVVPVSALTGHNVGRLERLVAERLPPGPQYFEPGQVTDQPETMIVGELVRQEVFRRTHQEVPYKAAVRVERMAMRGETLVVDATILVERDSQKGILIGKGGRMLRTIGQAARRRIEGLFATRVYLGLEVRVLERWSEDPRRLAELGYPEE